MKKKNSFAEGKDKKSNQYYIDNVEFYTACKERKEIVKEAIELGLPKPKLTKYLGESILKIANKMSESSHFRGYAFKEDMVMDAVETQLMYFDNFDPEKSNNPFAYFSQICYFAFLRRIGKERDYLYNNYQLGRNAKFITVDPFQHEDDDSHEFYETVRVRVCVTPWTAAHQAPQSLGFSRQEHWSGLPCPPPMHESEMRSEERRVGKECRSRWSP